MSITTAATAAPVRAACPAWCDHTHPITDEGVYHCAEVGRIDSGVLALVVSVAHWIPDDDVDKGPAVTLAWEEDGFVNLLEAIELDPAETVALIPLLNEANSILQNGAQS